MGLSMPIQPDHVTHISEIIPLKPNSIYLMLKKIAMLWGGAIVVGAPKLEGPVRPCLRLMAMDFKR
jgi:hypothetical protein